MLRISMVLGAPILFSSLLTVPVRSQDLSEITEQQLQLQMQREEARRKQDDAQPDVRLQGATAPVAGYPDRETPCFPIRSVVLEGQEASVFQWALRTVDDVQGRCLGSGGINVLIGKIQNTLIEQGYVTARVVAAPQDLQSGQLRLILVPGRVRAIHFPDARPRHWHAALPARAGALLNLRDIEQGLENFKRVPGAQADIQIVPAELPGESDLQVRWQGGSAWRLGLSVDDSGSDATGPYQGGVTLSLDNPTGTHDLFYVTVNRNLPGDSAAGGHGTRGYAAHYSVPWHYWLLTAQVNDYRYHQRVAGATQDYVYSGTSLNSELKAARLIYRDASRKTTLSVRAYQRRSHNYIDDTEVEVQRRRMGGFVLGLAHREFIGSATLDANLGWKIGTGNFGALPAPEELYGEGTARPRIVNIDLALQLPLTRALAWSSSWRGQWNRTALVPQDRFAIGGRYTVRGFDGESSLSAERGSLLRNDLSWSIPGSRHQVYLGLDVGRVSGPGATFLRGRRLSGAALGWRFVVGRLQADLFAGAPIHKPDGFRTDRVATGFNLNFDY
jgi:hemolysin activation/secretion protein